MSDSKGVVLQIWLDFEEQSDLIEMIRDIGPLVPAITAELSIAEHQAMLGDCLVNTQAAYGLADKTRGCLACPKDQPGIVVFSTGNGPRASVRSRALAGIWNLMHAALTDPGVLTDSAGEGSEAKP